MDLDLPPLPMQPLGLRPDPEDVRSTLADEAQPLDGRVTFGGPVAERIDDDDFLRRDPALAPFVASRAGYAFWLVRSRIGFVSGTADPPFVWASVDFRLESAPPGDRDAPVAAAMAPDRITHPDQRKITWRLSPQLALLEVEASLGSVEVVTERSRPKTSLESAGQLSANPRWTMRHTDESPLSGDQPELWLVLRTPRIGITRVRTVVQATVRRTGLLRFSTRDVAPGWLELTLP